MPDRRAPKLNARKGRKTRKGRKAKEVLQGMATPAATFLRFSDLPLEIRFLIWEFTFPEARLLKIVPKPKPARSSELKKSTSKDKKDSNPEYKYTIMPASYGATLPSIFFVNREPRNFALQHFTKIFGVYFNFDRDVLFFEFKNMLDKEVMILTEMFHEGLLGKFKHIAIDSGLWNWRWEGDLTSRNFAGWKAPCLIMNNICNIETCAVTFTSHTHQRDVMAPGKPWKLGSLNAKVSLDRYWRETSRAARSSIAQRTVHPYGEQVKLREGVELCLKGVHGRKRETLRRTLLRPEDHWPFYHELW